MAEKILAWHFVREDKRLGYGDGREVKVGETLSYHGAPSPRCCACGMHGSVRAFDALRYAPGPILCRVELSGEMDRSHDDKIAARHRKVLAMADATEMLRFFARQCALDVAHLWDMPDVVRRYLETGDELIRAAAVAAARYAAWDAAWDAARAAAGAAARYAARDAAWEAARYAASAAATEKQRDRFESMCLELINDANA